MIDLVQVLNDAMERYYVPAIEKMLKEHDEWRAANPEAAEWLDNFVGKWYE